MPPIIESFSVSRHNTWLEIDLSRLSKNLQSLKESNLYSRFTMAVVKANAYGHGLVRIANALEREVDYLGVSSLREVLELKEHQIETPVFVFGRLFGEEIRAALMANATLSVSSLEECLEINHIAGAQNRKAIIHIKMDTGMGRMGVSMRNALSLIGQIKQLDALDLEGIYTHFPTAEKDDGFREAQLKSFSSIIQTLFETGITFKYRHAANSTGMVKSPEPLLNLSRPGVMLYGIYPDSSLKNLITISPILSWKSRIVLVKTLKQGESSGYGRDFIAEQPTNIAIIPVGYSHGYPFTASRNAFALYRGKKIPLAGRVSMDYLTLNLGGMMAKPGEEVTLIGSDQGQIIRAEDLAQWAGTIPYEIVTRLQPSIPRLYR